MTGWQAAFARGARAFDLLGLPHDRQPPSREELLAMTHADDVAAVQQAWHQTIERNEVVEFESRQVRTDGQLRRMRTRAWAGLSADADTLPAGHLVDVHPLLHFDDDLFARP